MFLQIVVLLFIPYAMPLMMPSRRWLLAYAVAAAILLAIPFVSFYYTYMIKPPTRMTGLEGIGLVIPLSLAVATAAGTIVRTVTLFVRARSVVVAISVLGAGILTVAVLVWANR